MIEAPDPRVQMACPCGNPNPTLVGIHGDSAVIECDECVLAHVVTLAPELAMAPDNTSHDLFAKWLDITTKPSTSMPKLLAKNSDQCSIHNV